MNGQKIKWKQVEWSTLSIRQQRQALSRPKSSQSSVLRKKVKEITVDVRKRGDEALREWTKTLDGVDFSEIKVSAAEIARAEKQVSKTVRLAIDRAVRQLETFHRATMAPNVALEVSPGVFCRRESRPIERVGLYIPSGTAPLPSTVLMLGVPSRLAQNPTRVLCSPPNRDGEMNPFVVVAAKITGITSLFKVGGAQAIAAMAYGTETVPKVDKLFGPGNAWVTEAKLRVSLDRRGAAFDMPAGPSEVMVVADAQANPAFVAADLLSQAEHGTDSQVMLVSLCKTLIKNVELELQRQLPLLPRKEIAEKSLSQSVTILVDSMEEAFSVANAYASEHLILQIENANAASSRVRSAGSVFLGPWSPEAVGDYASGTNHVLPTYGNARAYSGLGVESFQTQITFQELTSDGLQELGPFVETLAEVEGLQAHRQAVSLRLKALQAEAEET